MDYLKHWFGFAHWVCWLLSCVDVSLLNRHCLTFRDNHRANNTLQGWKIPSHINANTHQIQPTLMSINIPRPDGSSSPETPQERLKRLTGELLALIEEYQPHIQPKPRRRVYFTNRTPPALPQPHIPNPKKLRKLKRMWTQQYR